MPPVSIGLPDNARVADADVRAELHGNRQLPRVARRVGRCAADLCLTTWLRRRGV